MKKRLTVIFKEMDTKAWLKFLIFLSYHKCIRSVYQNQLGKSRFYNQFSLIFSIASVLVLVPALVPHSNNKTPPSWPNSNTIVISNMVLIMVFLFSGFVWFVFSLSLYIGLYLEQVHFSSGFAFVLVLVSFCVLL